MVTRLGLVSPEDGAELAEGGFDASLGPLFEIINGPVAWEVFNCALEFGVFDDLVTPVTADDLALRRSFDPDVCRDLLGALLSLGLLERKGNAYAVKAGYGDYLRRDGDKSLADVIPYLARRSHGGLGSLGSALTGLLTEGRTAELAAAKPDWAAVCSELSAYQQSLAAGWARRIVSALPGFERATALLDLAGGPGLCGMRIAEANPNLHVTLFDQPGTVTYARDVVAAEGMEDRVTLIGGNYNMDDLGSGYDLVWASLCFYFADPDLETLLRKLHNAMKPGGRLISFHEGLDGTEADQPMLMRRFMPTVWNRHRIMKRGEVAGAMEASGFALDQRRIVETAIGPIEISIARK